ncbi:MAG: hypothetical protein AABZ15_11995 [Nitrospirota bacterium]
MHLFKPIVDKLFSTYVNWFGKQLTNEGQLFPFVDRELTQNPNKKLAILTITLRDSRFDCGIEMSFEKTLADKLGIGAPKGFSKKNLEPDGKRNNEENVKFCIQFNEENHYFIADHTLKRDVPFTIEIPVDKMAEGFGQITISLPFKLGFGGGSLNANTPVGLGDPMELEKEMSYWRKLRERHSRNRQGISG